MSRILHTIQGFTFVILCLWTSHALAYIEPDTTAATYNREIYQESLDDYKYQSAYNYEENPDRETNILQRAWQKFKKWLVEVLGSNTAGNIIDLFFYLVMGAGLVALVYYLIISQYSGLIERDKSPAIGEVNIVDVESSPDTILHELYGAERNGNYRNAIRYLFLLVIKTIDQKNLMDWHPEMTNSELLHEFPDGQDKMQLEEMVKIYEYTWYGEHEIGSEERYKQYKEVFNGLIHLKEEAV